jgi:hypothetical protein
MARCGTELAQYAFTAPKPRAKTSSGQGKDLERVTGIEPAFSAWEADVLPLNYTRRTAYDEAG